MRSRRLSGCQLVMVTARGAVSAGLGLTGLALAEVAAVAVEDAAAVTVVAEEAAAIANSRR